MGCCDRRAAGWIFHFWYGFILNLGISSNELSARCILLSHLAIMASHIKICNVKGAAHYS